MVHAQERVKFMLRYDGLKTMREMRMADPNAGQHKPSLHELMNSEEKTKADGSRVTLIDLMFDKRYEKIVWEDADSDYYEEDYYYSETN